MEKIKAKTSNIIRTRLELCMTQEDVCKETGLNTSTYCYVEKGKTYPSPKTAKKVCACFNKPFNELFEIVRSDGILG